MRGVAEKLLTGNPKLKAWESRGKTIHLRILGGGDMEFYEDFSAITGRYEPIPGFEEYYITEFGEVYSTKPVGIGKRHKLHKVLPKNPGKANKYFNVILCKDGVHYTKSIHRLVAESFVDGYFDGAVVNHIDGDNRNNIASNLEWTTTKDNIHKSYMTSGIGAVRNCLTWVLYNPNGEEVGRFAGNNLLKKYIKENDIDCSPETIVKYGESKGYKIEKVNCKL